MKLLIIEGADRVGKNLIVEKLLKEFDHCVYVHFGFPQGQTSKEKLNYQVHSFNAEFVAQQEIRDEESNLQHVFRRGLYVWNRSHIGECVYGPMYRSTATEWVFEMESKFLAGDDDVYLLYLYADEEFRKAQDDGKSHSSDPEKMQTEARLFETAVNKSCIANKLKLRVDNGHGEYIDHTEILKVVKSFLHI